MWLDSIYQDFITSVPANELTVRPISWIETIDACSYELLLKDVNSGAQLSPEID